MIINRFGGGGSGSIPVGDIITTHRTITDANYQFCDGSMIANPSNDMIDTALARGEFALGSAPSSTGVYITKNSGPFYDGKYYLRPGTDSNSYPVVEVWTRGNNGIFTKNGLKTIMSKAVSTPLEYAHQTSAIVKCGNYYYYAFSTTDGKAYIAYTTNPAGAWSTREVDLTLSGATFYNRDFMSRLYTNDSTVRLLVVWRDQSNSNLYYFVTYEFSGDTSNLAYIKTQNFSIAGSYGSDSSLPHRGILRIGNYYVIGGYGDNFVYSTFTGNWTILGIRGTSWYDIEGIAFDGTNYYQIREEGSDGDYDRWLLGGTSVPGFYQSGSLSMHFPLADDFPASNSVTGVMLGTNTNANGPAIFKYKNIPYMALAIPNSNPSKLAIFKLDQANRNITRVALITASQGFDMVPAIPDPTRPFQYVVQESYTPYLVGPAVPDLRSLNRNSYMRIG